MSTGNTLEDKTQLRRNASFEDEKLELYSGVAMLEDEISLPWTLYSSL